MFRGIQSIHGQLFYPKSLVLKKYSSSECGYVVIRNHQSRTRFRMPQIRCSLDGAASLSLTHVFERKGGGVSKALCAGRRKYHLCADYGQSSYEVAEEG